MRRQQGVRKIDTFEVEGATLHVHCDMESGEFRIEVDREMFRGKNLADVRAKAVAHVQNKMRANFKPVIMVEKHDGGFDGNKEERLCLKYERYFRAEIDDKFLWKVWNLDAKSSQPDEDRTDGKPSAGLVGFPGWRSDATFLDYTPERWLALRSISKAMAELNKRLIAATKPDKCADFLAGIAQRGVERLMAPEKKEGKA
jgi:hypothetical protein